MRQQRHRRQSITIPDDVRRHVRRVRRAACLGLCLGLVLGGSASRAATEEDADLFDEIFRESEPVRESLETLTARITETTTSPLLTRPLVEEGTIILVRPSQVWLTYTSPDARTITIDDDYLTVRWPSRGLHETRNIGAAQRRVQRYFVDATPDELRAHFRIDATTATDRANTYLVTMVPTRPQILEGVTRLELWVDRDSFMPEAMRLTFPSGETKLLAFEDVEVNPELEWPDASGATRRGPAATDHRIGR